MGQQLTDTTWADLAVPLWQQPNGTRPQPPAAETAGAPQAPGHDLVQRPVPGPPVPGLVPRRERLLLPRDYLPHVTDPPELGWRRAGRRAGLRWLGPGAREQRHREWARTIRQPVPVPRVIAVVSPKGGVGKSTTTALLGGVLARLRGDLVAALDANPDSGNLAARLREPHSRLGAQELHRDAGQVTRYSDLVPYLTTSGSGLCAVRSNPDADARLGPAEYRALLSLLSRFYSIIVVDLGTGMREPAFQAIIEAADAVVAVTGPAFDAVEVLAEGLDWLSRQFPAIFRTGIAVVNGIAPGSRAPDPARIAQTLEDWVPAVVQVPRDPHLAGGGVAQWAMLRNRTQDAYLELGATVIDALPEAGRTSVAGAES